MKRYRLYEEKHPQNLSVQLTPDIVSQIEEICECNQDNKEQLLEWIKYIEALKNYISNPVIAFDYANNHKHRPNGCIVINEIGYEAEFSTNIDISNQVFVCIYKRRLYSSCPK